MKWSSLPELTVKKGDPAKYQGVLVPELNYKNYKTFEAVTPEVKKLAAVEVVQANNSDLFHDILWFVVGAAVGALAVSVK